MSQFGDLALHQLLIGVGIARITDEEPVAAQNKNIAELRDSGAVFQFGNFVGRICEPLRRNPRELRSISPGSKPSIVRSSPISGNAT